MIKIHPYLIIVYFYRMLKRNFFKIKINNKTKIKYKKMMILMIN